MAAQDLGRIAFGAHQRLEIFPVNYRTDGVHVVFRSAAGTKADVAPGLPAVFEIDGWDPRRATGWSVVARGALFDVTDTGDGVSAHLRDLAVNPLAPGVREHWVALYVDEITGRQFTSGWRSLASISAPRR